MDTNVVIVLVVFFGFCGLWLVYSLWKEWHNRIQRELGLLALIGFVSAIVARWWPEAILIGFAYILCHIAFRCGQEYGANQENKRLLDLMKKYPENSAKEILDLSQEMKIFGYGHIAKKTKSGLEADER